MATSKCRRFRLFWARTFYSWCKAVSRISPRVFTLSCLPEMIDLPDPPSSFILASSARACLLYYILSWISCFISSNW